MDFLYIFHSWYTIISSIFVSGLIIVDLITAFKAYIDSDSHRYYDSEKEFIPRLKRKIRVSLIRVTFGVVIGALLVTSIKEAFDKGVGYSWQLSLFIAFCCGIILAFRKFGPQFQEEKEFFDQSDIKKVKIQQTQKILGMLGHYQKRTQKSDAYRTSDAMRDFEEDLKKHLNKIES